MPQNIFLNHKMLPYDLKHTEVRNCNNGTLYEPLLFEITSGQKNFAILNFHIKIEGEFHTCRINKINSSLTLGWTKLN